MFRLMSSQFDRVRETQFLRDLDDKQRIILLRDAAGDIRGFSAMTVIEAQLGRERIAAVYAGDTVIEPECWGHTSWLFAWARSGAWLARGSGVEKTHLVLLTSTHRSYRFLPGFFHEYYPRTRPSDAPRCESPNGGLCASKVSDEYDAAPGVWFRSGNRPRYVLIAEPCRGDRK